MGTRRKLSILVDAEYEGSREIQQAEDDIKGLDKVSEDSGMSLAKLATTGAALGVALGGAAIAAKQAYEFVGQGAQLIAAKEKFDNLSASIDTTGDVLIGKLKSATNGMVSQADLISASTDIMNLGLADSEDGVVRLASAVGALNLDMGVLALTLANDSTARLDSLGLSLEDVAQKKKELIENGFIGDAFDEAVLIALEEKMVLLGDASQTTAGEMMIVEAAMADISAESKILAATMAGPQIKALAGAVVGQNKLNEGIKEGVITTKAWNEIVNEGATIQEGTQAAIDKTNQLLRAQSIDMTMAEETVIAYYQGMAQATEEVVFFTDASNEYVSSGLAQAEATRDAFKATQDSIAAYEQGAQFISTYAEAGLAAAESSRQQAGAVSLANEQYGTLMGFIEPLEGTAEGVSEAFDNLAVSIVNAQLADAVAAGQLTAEEAALSSINVQEGLGLIDEAQAENLRVAAEQFAVIDEAITLMADDMLSAGGITVEEAEKMNNAIGLVEGGAQSSGEAIALLATEGVVQVGDLTASFDSTYDSIDAAWNRTDDLKDIVFGLPDEKVITIRINTVGSIPQGFGGDGVNATEVAEDLGG